jgi:hypothetical protein
MQSDLYLLQSLRFACVIKFAGSIKCAGSRQGGGRLYLASVFLGARMPVDSHDGISPNSGRLLPNLGPSDHPFIRHGHVGLTTR